MSGSGFGDGGDDVAKEAVGGPVTLELDVVYGYAKRSGIGGTPPTQGVSAVGPGTIPGHGFEEG